MKRSTWQLGLVKVLKRKNKNFQKKLGNIGYVDFNMKDNLLFINNKVTEEFMGNITIGLSLSFRRNRFLK